MRERWKDIERAGREEILLYGLDEEYMLPWI